MATNERYIMIDKFLGEYRFLSNFWECEFVDLRTDIRYKSAEHYYQSMKTEDETEKEMIRNATVSECKKLGNKVTLRDGWDGMRISVMDDAVFYKFTQNEELKLKLMKTFPQRLIEGNTWHDNYWGNCICKKCEKRFGDNYLGWTLEHWREIFIHEMLQDMGM